MFGDDKAEAVLPSTWSTSDTFRSLLQPRKSFVVVTPAVKESVAIDSYPLMGASSGPADVSRPQPAFIRNGIVNFDASVERKIFLLEAEKAPAPEYGELAGFRRTDAGCCLAFRPGRPFWNNGGVDQSEERASASSAGTTARDPSVADPPEVRRSKSK